MNINSVLKRKSHTGQYCIDPEQPLTDAVKLMMQHRVGSLVVMEGGRLVGIVTERDVMRAVDDHLPRFADVAVRDVMTADPITCAGDTGIDVAMDTMLHNATGNRIRHLPIVEQGRLVGVLSIGDVIDALLTETRFENQLLKNYIKNWPEDAPATRPLEST